ncbi:universal stress protein [Fibrella forsythiae]|uniref:Universal stress protein n=1 Tax=Fibrella forsythiae TaxID=2817061 RepID=A0ABS3JB03_9BACT|nr:universal stress protein [Fibrella forsythiae]MBO0947157.1 universal stress protein [Fibrella forsythiae]
MKKVLLLTNFSPASRHAVAFARAFFGDVATDFHLLYPHPDTPDGIHEPRYDADTTRVSYMSRLHEAVGTLRDETITDWHTFRSSDKPGQPYDIVEESVDAEAYDIVVIGPSDEGTDIVFGNSAIALIRKLKANVLVVPDAAPIRPIHQIVLAIDFANLTDYQLLDTVKELVLRKGATLTLLTIDTPDKKVIHVEQEALIRHHLRPIDPTIAHIQASNAKQGIDDFLAGHTVDLLVTIPRYKGRPNPSATNSHVRAKAFSPAVPLLTIYDDARTEAPEHIEDLSNLDFAL